MGILDPLTKPLGLISTMARAGVIAPMRPDKYLRIVSAMQRENMAITSGFAAAARPVGTSRFSKRKAWRKRAINSLP